MVEEKHLCNKLGEDIEITFNAGDNPRQWLLVYNDWENFAAFYVNQCPFCGERPAGKKEEKLEQFFNRIASDIFDWCLEIDIDHGSLVELMEDRWKEIAGENDE